MPEGQTPQNNEPSPELIKKVTDRVYALLLADLKREQERTRRKNTSKRKR